MPRRSFPNSSRFDRIVSFNGDRFDFEVLSAYQPVKHLLGKSFDLLVDLHRRLGHRIKLDDLARETLGNKKTGDGVEVVQWWRAGRKEEVCKYCENDVKLLVDLMEFARRNKYVVVNSRHLRVDWPDLAHCGFCSPRLETRGFPLIRKTPPASEEAGNSEMARFESLRRHRQG